MMGLAAKFRELLCPSVAQVASNPEPPLIITEDSFESTSHVEPEGIVVEFRASYLRGLIKSHTILRIAWSEIDRAHKWLAEGSPTA